MFSQVRCEVHTATGMKMALFWDVAPRSLVDINRHFRGAYCLHHQCDGWSNSSEALVNIFQTMRCYIPEESHLFVESLGIIYI
jgi:hypothetical protein